MIGMYGLGPNDNRNLMSSMMNNMMNYHNMNNINRNIIFHPMMLNNNINSNNINNNNIINNDVDNDIINNIINLDALLNIFMRININLNPESSSTSLEPKDIKRKDDLDVKCDVDRLLKSNHELENKNKDIQTIINYIPFTIIQDEPKKLKDEPRCVICLTDFKIGQKVSALPCCHSFHTKCLDDWIIRNTKCPVCKFEVTLKNLIGEDFIKEQLKRIEEKKLEKERKEKEKERINRERREKELREKKEKERINKERREKAIRDRKEKELRDKNKNQNKIKTKLPSNKKK